MKLDRLDKNKNNKFNKRTWWYYGKTQEENLDTF